MIQQIIDFIKNEEWVASAFMSLAVVFGVLVLRWVLLKGIARMPIKSPEMRRRWILQVRNLTLSLLTIGLAMIWAEELRTLAFSLIAVVVAVVLATKELILCLSGSFLKASSGAFSIGDRIEVNGMRGDVIDQTLLTTTLMEVGPGDATHQHTGRMLVIPNSQFLSTPVMNESFTGKFGVHSFNVPIKRDQDYRLHETILMHAANEVCKPHMDQARASMDRLLRTESVDVPSVEPRVTLSFPSPDVINLVIRVATPIHRKGRTEQQIVRKYLEALPPSTADQSQDAKG